MRCACENWVGVVWCIVGVLIMKWVKSGVVFRGGNGAPIPEFEAPSVGISPPQGRGWGGKFP